MSEQKDFNLLRFIYGELYLCSRNKTVATTTIETWQYYSWRRILDWLVSHKHISAVKVERVDTTHRRISYIFNDKNLMYQPYLVYLQRLQDV